MDTPPESPVDTIELRPWTDARARAAAAFVTGTAVLGFGLSISDDLLDDDSTGLRLWVVGGFSAVLMLGSLWWFWLSLSEWVCSHGPKLRLAVTDRTLRASGTLWGIWEFEERPKRIRALHIRLEGRRYRDEDGDRSRGRLGRAAKAWNDIVPYKDYELLDSYQIADTDEPDAIRSAAFRFEVPEGLRSDYRSSRVLVTWVLVLHGEVDLWPDFRNEYRLRSPRRRKSERDGQAVPEPS